MATWDMNRASDKTCPQCKSTYDVKYHHVPLKDSDYYNCVTCGLELDRWKSTRFPIYTPKVMAKWPNDDPTL